MTETQKSFKLTRFLYNEEEVKLSLISSLLNKKNILESYYWFSELYYSKLDVRDIIWEIYFDYYALINPKLEQYIFKKINDWEQSKEIEPLLYIIKNLNISKHECRVFLLRQISNSPNLCQKYIYLDCKSKTIKKYDKKYHNLLISLKYKRWIDICYYLKKLFTTDCNNYTIYISIFSYLLNDDYIFNIYDRLWKERIDKRDYHFTLKMISRTLMDMNYLNIKNVYVSSLKKDIDEIKTLEKVVEPIYKTLPTNRWFKIDENIGSFDLSRFYIQNYRNENYNWEYYASFTPLWRERIDEFKAFINHKNKTIEFDDDDSLEKFYEKYGYELDEQSKDTQDYSLLTIEKKNWIEWFKYVGYGHLETGNVNIKRDDNDNENQFTIGFDICLDDLPDDFILK
jgi:hypothetical protein